MCDKNIRSISKGEFIQLEIDRILGFGGLNPLFLLEHNYHRGDLVEVIEDITSTKGLVILSTGYKLSITIKDVVIKNNLIN